MRPRDARSAASGMQTSLFGDPELVQFYDIENLWADDDRYCLELAVGKKTVLDLGCGTGRLAAALASGREVVGVDPAAAMLTAARQRQGGSAVTWIEADARSVRLGRRFELVLLTGHTFQVFLTDNDQRAVCDTIAAHLAPDGTFIFDSREPSREEWRKWSPSQSLRSIEHPALGRIEAWNDAASEPGSEIVTYWTFYRASDGRVWEAQSRIRFASKSTIGARIEEAGLRVDRWLGNWRGDQWAPEAKEIIPVGGLAGYRQP
jgi:SAM-dependent methyltransferase